ncbi:MAG: ribonuclease III [Sphingobacteriales bacterium]|nr:MAG: ribonuclease III [Sphingobacteriales bacterium]
MAGIVARIRRYLGGGKELSYQLDQILGFHPQYLPYYEAALTHRSVNEVLAANNERLEFLGDAILGSVVAEYLFKKYPTQDEGFLTELRSRIVCRESLNAIALQMGLDKLIQFNRADRALGRSHIFGNALEALVGAVYLDTGYEKTCRFILRILLRKYVDIDALAITDTNYKNQLLSLAQRRGDKVDYELISDQQEGARRIFTVAVLFNGAEVARGTGYTKKAAGQMASQKALETL